MRAQRGKVAGILIFGILFCLGYSVILFGPPQWSYRMMKKIAKDSALTYRTSGSLQSAKQKYLLGLDKEDIPTYVAESACMFQEGSSKFTIDCEWVAPITIPILEMDVSKLYKFRMHIDRDGVVEEY